MRCTFKIMLHYSYTTWGCADFFGVFQAVCRKGWVQGDGHSLVKTPSGSLGPENGPAFTPRPGVQVKLWQWAWLGGADGLSGWVCCFLPSIYNTYVIFSFIEVGESKFRGVQWKRLFPCDVHVSLLSVRSHVSCLITVFWMFANQTLGEYSIKT
jgi:hypothetical protein